MTLGVKCLVGLVSLSGLSCGGYMVYKNVFNSEKAQEENKSGKTQQNLSVPVTDSPSPAVDN